MSKTDAIRVIVGDGSRVDRDLVRFMLERDGFRVISSVAASEDLSRAAGVMQPDAVVLGEELLDVRGADAARLVRNACPMAKIVLFSALPAAAAVGPAEPDAVLERGIGLKDLTPALNDLFEPVAAGAGVVTLLPTASAAAQTSDEPAPARVATAAAPPRATDSRRRSVAVLTASAAAMLLLIFAVARTYPSQDSLTRASSAPSVTPGAGVSVAPSSGGGASVGVGATSAPDDTAQTHLTQAMHLYGQLREALRGGSLFEVTRLARELYAERAVAQAAGANLDQLNGLIQTLPLTSGLDPQYASALRTVLGSALVPPSEETNQDSTGSGPSGGSGDQATPPTDSGSPVPPPTTDSGGVGPSDGGSGTEPSESPSPSPAPSGSESAKIGDSDATRGGADDPSTDAASDQAPGDGSDGFSSPPESPRPSSGGDQGIQDSTRSGGTSGDAPSAPAPAASRTNTESTPPSEGNHLGLVRDDGGSRADADADSAGRNG